MNIRNRKSAFTLIELLTVIAIIALLVAIAFPVFATAREQARQSNTMGNLHTMYVGARLFYEDEGFYPNSLFGYAMVPIQGSNPPAYRPALPTDPASAIIPMDKATEQWTLTGGLVEHGYLYHEQVKDYIDFLNADNLVTNKTAYTIAYYPLNSPFKPGQQVVWEINATDSTTGCTLYGDSDLPSVSGVDYINPQTHLGMPKLFYKMDSMDIGPMLDKNGNQMYESDGVTPKYELHYTPNWTHELYSPATQTTQACDVDSNGNPITNQLKYKYPPTEHTILTYVTQHAATAHSGNVILLLLSGTARKTSVLQAYNQLPLKY
ncbi:MAG TPA: type II secretion system protein [Chthonomonadaceae bacterium]|nr:type II secretion system protein [Chthonomonadaceae bacterium]